MTTPVAGVIDPGGERDATCDPVVATVPAATASPRTPTPT